jgi:hypothetical protein
MDPQPGNREPYQSSVSGRWHCHFCGEGSETEDQARACTCRQDREPGEGQLDLSGARDADRFAREAERIVARTNRTRTPQEGKG